MFLIQFLTDVLRVFGRCFTINTPQYVIAMGIDEIELGPTYYIKIMIHSPGLFRPQETRYTISVKHLNQQFRVTKYSVDHEEFKMIQYRNQECRKSEEITFDDCIEGMAYKVHTEFNSL